MPNTPPVVSREAANALAKLSKKQSSVVDRLLAALSDDNEWVQQQAAGAFENISEVSPFVMNALLTILPTTGTHTRLALIRAFRQIGKGKPQVVDALIKVLADPEANIKFWAVNHLGWRSEGNKQPEIINALFRTLADPDFGRVRRIAAEAIGNIGINMISAREKLNVTEILLKSFYDSSWLGKQGSARALGQLFWEQPQIIDTLLKELSSPEMSIRAAALIALRFAMNEELEPHAIDALLPILSDTNWFIRQKAVGVFDPSTRKWSLDMINALLPAFSDPSSYVRQSAAGAFWSLNTEINIDPHVIDVLRQSLVDSHWGVRDRLPEHYPILERSLMERVLSNCYTSINPWRYENCKDTMVFLMH